MSTPNRRTEHSEQGQIQGAAQRIVREGVPLDQASFRETDKPEFIQKVREHGQSLFGAPEKAVSAKTVVTAEVAEPATENKRELSEAQKSELFASLEARFSKQPYHYKRPKGIDFAKVKVALEADPEKMWSLAQMENTGGAPDVIAIEGDEFIFADCSAESPDGRCNCVFDKAAEQYAEGFTKGFDGNAVDMAKLFGADIMTDDTYRNVLQELGKFDLDTLSWVLANDPAEQARIRKSGDALRARRYGGGGFVRKCGAYDHHGDWAWRGVLKVKMV